MLTSKLRFMDTHCHLDTLKGQPLDLILAEADAQHVTKLITVAADLRHQERVQALATQYPQIYCSQGLHPHEAHDFSLEFAQLLRVRLQGEKVVALGEIGLDFHYNFSSRQQQMAAFEAQLEIAVELQCPIILHSREADQEMMAMLKNIVGHLGPKGVFHSFSSSVALAEFALQEGFYLGFNGMVTFPKAENVRAIVQLTPPDRRVVETDAPYLTPVPHRGKENGPQYIPLIVAKMANILGVTVAELAEDLYQNSCRLFRLPLL